MYISKIRGGIWGYNFESPDSMRVVLVDQEGNGN